MHRGQSYISLAARPRIRLRQVNRVQRHVGQQLVGGAVPLGDVDQGGNFTLPARMIVKAGSENRLVESRDGRDLGGRTLLFSQRPQQMRQSQPLVLVSGTGLKMR